MKYKGKHKSKRDAFLRGNIVYTRSGRVIEQVKEVQLRPIGGKRFELPHSIMTEKYGPGTLKGVDPGTLDIVYVYAFIATEEDS